MGELDHDRYVIRGKPIPYRSDHDVIDFAELCVADDRIVISLLSSPLGRLECDCEIWEHTIHEMENLSSALHCAAKDVFPPTSKVPRPESNIGTSVNLTLSTHIEMGYSLADPGSPRAVFSCWSRNWGLPSKPSLGVVIGLAIGGGFSEVVVEPQQAKDLAEWLDGQIAGISEEAKE